MKGSLLLFLSPLTKIAISQGTLKHVLTALKLKERGIPYTH